jgi:hypothetical protein
MNEIPDMDHRTNAERRADGAEGLGGGGGRLGTARAYVIRRAAATVIRRG